MNKQTILHWLSLVGKVLSVAGGLASYANFIPPKYAPIAVAAFGVSSILKDAVNRIGDLLDDGQANQSFR